MAVDEGTDRREQLDSADESDSKVSSTDKVDTSNLRARSLRRKSLEGSLNNTLIGKAFGGYSQRKSEVFPKIDKDVVSRITYSDLEKIARDPIVSFSLNLQQSIIKCLPYSIKSGDKAMEIILKNHLQKHYSKIVEGFCTSFVYGFAYAQKYWNKDRITEAEPFRTEDGETEYRVVFDESIDSISSIKFIKPTTSNIAYFVDVVKEEILYLRQMKALTDGKKMKEFYTYVNREDLIWFSDGDPFDSVFGMSKLMNLIVESEIGDIIVKYQLEDLDNSASPPLGVGYPPGYTEIEDENGDRAEISNEELAAKIGQQILKSRVYTYPNTVNPKTGEKQWEIKVMDNWTKIGQEKLSKAFGDFSRLKLLGSGLHPALMNLTERNPSGPEIEGAMELLMFLQEPFVKKMEETIRKDFLDDIVVMNFPRGRRLPYDFSIDKSIFNKRGILKEILTNMVRGNMQLIGQGKTTPQFMPNVKSIFEQLNIPYAETETQFIMNKNEENLNDNGEQEDEDTEVTPLDDAEEDRKKNDENRTTKRKPRTRKDGHKETIIDGA